MTEATTAAFLDMVAGRRGHFQLESGDHSGFWLDLDPLFVAPRRIDEFVTTLATALRAYAVTAVCGPPIGGAERLRGQRIALVDDVMSAGSALRGTYAELQAHAVSPYS